MWYVQLPLVDLLALRMRLLTQLKAGANFYRIHVFKSLKNAERVLVMYDMINMIG